MSRRTKRASAAAAELKMKAQIEDINDPSKDPRGYYFELDDIESKTKTGTKTAAAKKKNKKNSKIKIFKKTNKTKPTKPTMKMFRKSVNIISKSDTYAISKVESKPEPSTKRPADDEEFSQPIRSEHVQPTMKNFRNLSGPSTTRSLKSVKINKKSGTNSNSKVETKPTPNLSPSFLFPGPNENRRGYDNCDDGDDDDEDSLFDFGRPRLDYWDVSPHQPLNRTRKEQTTILSATEHYNLRWSLAARQCAYQRRLSPNKSPPVPRYLEMSKYAHIPDTPESHYLSRERFESSLEAARSTIRGETMSGGNESASSSSSSSAAAGLTKTKMKKNKMLKDPPRRVSTSPGAYSASV